MKGLALAGISAARQMGYVCCSSSCLPNITRNGDRSVECPADEILNIERVTGLVGPRPLCACLRCRVGHRDDQALGSVGQT